MQKSFLSIKTTNLLKLEQQPTYNFNKKQRSKKIKKSKIILSNFAKKFNNFAKKSKLRFDSDTYDTHGQGPVKPITRQLKIYLLQFINKNSDPLFRNLLKPYLNKFLTHEFNLPFIFDKAKGLEYRFQALIFSQKFDRDKNRYFMLPDIGTNYKPKLSAKNVWHFSSSLNHSYGNIKYSRTIMPYILPSLKTQFSTINIKPFCSSNKNLEFGGRYSNKIISNLLWYNDEKYDVMSFRKNFHRKLKSDYYSISSLISTYYESKGFLSTKQKSPQSSLLWTLTPTSYRSFFLSSYNKNTRIYFPQRFFRHFYMSKLKSLFWTKKQNDLWNGIRMINNSNLLAKFSSLLKFSINESLHVFMNCKILNLMSEVQIIGGINKFSILVEILNSGWLKTLHFNSWLVALLSYIILKKKLCNLIKKSPYNVNRNFSVLKYDFNFLVIPGPKFKKYKKWFINDIRRNSWIFHSLWKQPRYKHPVKLFMKKNYAEKKRKSFIDLSKKIKKIMIILIKKFYFFLIKRSFIFRGSSISKLYFFINYFFKYNHMINSLSNLNSSYINLLFSANSVISIAINKFKSVTHISSYLKSLHSNILRHNKSKLLNIKNKVRVQCKIFKSLLKSNLFFKKFKFLWNLRQKHKASLEIIRRKTIKFFWKENLLLINNKLCKPNFGLQSFKSLLIPLTKSKDNWLDYSYSVLHNLKKVEVFNPQDFINLCANYKMLKALSNQGLLKKLTFLKKKILHMYFIFQNYSWNSIKKSEALWAKICNRAELIFKKTRSLLYVLSIIDKKFKARKKLNLTNKPNSAKLIGKNYLKLKLLKNKSSKLVRLINLKKLKTKYSNKLIDKILKIRIRRKYYNKKWNQHNNYK